MLRSNNPAVKAFFSFAIPLAAIEWRPLAFVELFNGVLKDLNARCRVEDRGVTLRRGFSRGFESAVFCPGFA